MTEGTDVFIGTLLGMESSKAPSHALSRRPKGPGTNDDGVLAIAHAGAILQWHEVVIQW